MSDDEDDYEYDYGSDDDQCFGSDEEEDKDDDLIEIENSYYEGDDYIKEDPKRAVELFEKVVELETSRGDEVTWRFKALQQLVKVHFNLQEYSQMIKRYRDMLVYMSSVTRNECTESINMVLDTILTATDSQVLSEMYEITLEALKSAKNERLWFNTNLKLAKLYLEGNKINDVERILELLKQSCRNSDGTDDLSKGSLLLEAYCLEIQLCTATRDAARMRSIYPNTLNMNNVVSDPRIMGLIREEGGKMYMSEAQWIDAYNEFYEAFRHYQASGNARAKTCLKYVVLSSMLGLTDINPFDAREAKVYIEDPEIKAMSDLRKSLEANDIRKFERTIRDKKNKISDEVFLMTYIEPLRKRMQQQVLLNLVIPYKKVTLLNLAVDLNLNVPEVSELLRGLILDGKLNGCIDQMAGVLTMESEMIESVQYSRLKTAAIDNYSSSLSKSVNGFEVKVGGLTVF